MSDSIFNDYHIAVAIQWPAPARSLHELTKAIGALHGGHVLTLRQALVQLNLMDEATLDALHQERPDLLRNRSAELVNRFHVSADDLNHAMARMASLPDVDAENFEVAADAFDVVSLAAAPMTWCRWGASPTGFSSHRPFPPMKAWKTTCAS